MTATQIAHDIIVTFFLLAGMWAVCSVLREDVTRALRGRRLRRKWRDRSKP